jgi:leader peptidase (prepilin peptidase)/N-methyltransferase
VPALDDFPLWFVRWFAVLFGLIWGSFLNVVVHRVPRGMSLSKPASHCPGCKQPIPFYRNVPLVSWLLQRGRAACCGVKISARYPMVELIGGALSLAILEVRVLPLHAPLGHALAVYVSELALALGLVAAAFIDLEHMLVPDAITLGGTVVGLGTFALRGLELVDVLAGAALGFVIVWLPFDVLYARLRGRPGMGLGDAKLLMLAGAWLGWKGVPIVLGAGAVQGALVAIGMTLSGKKLEEPEAVKREREEMRAELEKLTPEERAEVEKELARDPLAEDPEEGWGKARVAFGPFLILATLECLLLGPDRILGWLGQP